MSTSPNDKSSTPGPWTTRDTHDNSTEISSEHFSGRVLATVHAPMVMNSDNDHEEAANANLIAAAPTLLAEARCTAAWLLVLIPYLREIVDDKPMYAPLLSNTEAEFQHLDSAVRKAMQP